MVVPSCIVEWCTWSETKMQIKFQEVQGPFWLHVHDCWEIFPKDAKVKFSLFRKSGKKRFGVYAIVGLRPTDDGVDAETFLPDFLNKLNFTFASFGKISQQSCRSKTANKLDSRRNSQLLTSLRDLRTCVGGEDDAMVTDKTDVDCAPGSDTDDASRDAEGRRARPFCNANFRLWSFPPWRLNACLGLMVERNPLHQKQIDFHGRRHRRWALDISLMWACKKTPGSSTTKPLATKKQPEQYQSVVARRLAEREDWGRAHHPFYSCFFLSFPHIQVLMWWKPCSLGLYLQTLA